MKLQIQTITNQLKSARSAWQTAALTTVTALVYLLRAHPYLFKPQLFAEDGVIWLAEGHNKSVWTLLRPVNGFFHFPERLFGYVVARLPLQLAPLIFVVSAWLLFILMTYYLLSSRTKIFTNNYERIFMVTALCLIANINELFFNFSNSVFLMGIIGTLILLAQKPKNRLIAVAEKVFFVLSCFTLPFAWFYLPLALVERFKYKRKEWFFLVTSLIASIAQGLCYIISHVNRSPITLLSLFSKWTLLELYNQMIVPAIRFARIDIPVADYTAHHYSVFFVFLTVIALLIATYAVLRKSNKQVWYLLFFLAAMTFASVKSPTLSVKLPIDALKTMAVVQGGSRYFVYGVLAVMIIYVKAAYLTFMPKARYIFLVVFISFGLLTSFHYQEFFIDKGFADYTHQYSHAISQFQSGKVNTVDIPVNPVSWHMRLSRHAKH